MVYDSYRPGIDSRVSGFDGNEDSMFWRRDGRDEREERRGRRPSEGAPHLESRRSLSPRRRSRSRSPRPRLQRNHSASTRLDNSDQRTQPERRNRRSSDVSHHTQTRSLVTIPLTSQSTAHGQFSPNIMSQHSTTADIQTTKSNDPRLKIRTQNIMPSLDAALSPAASATEDAIDLNDQGAVTKELVRVLLLSNEAKQEQEILKKRHNHLTGELETALRLFSKSNAYTEKIREEIRSVETSLKAKTAVVEKIKKQEEIALRASDTLHKPDATVLAEIQSLKAKFAAEESRASKLRESNEKLLQQVTSLASTVNDLQAQIKQQQHATLQSKFQEQIDLIKNKKEDAALPKQDKQAVIDLKNDLKKLKEETLEKLQSDVKQQKLGLARLNDVFVSQDSFRKLSTDLDTLSARISSTPKEAQTQPGSYVTRDALQAYISTFNKFQDKIEVRLDNVEKSKWLTNDDLANYAKTFDLNHQVQTLRTTYDGKIKELQTRSNSFIKDVTNATAKSVKAERDVHAVSEARKALSDRVEAIEGIQHTLRLQGLSGFSKTDGETMQKDITALKSSTQAQSHVVNGITHSVRSLNSRFNNLTSEHLARQMVTTIEPMLATVKPQITAMSTQLHGLRSAQDRFNTEHVTIANRIVNHDQLLQGLHTGLETLHKANKNQDVRVNALATDIKTLDTNTKQWNESNEENVRAVRKDISNVRDLIAVSVTGMDQALRTKIGVLRDFVNAENEKGIESSKANTKSELESARNEQQASFDSLLQQVREARDNIDKRLTLVEDTLPKSKEPVPTTENGTVTTGNSDTTTERVGDITDAAKSARHAANGTPGGSSQGSSNGSLRKKKKNRSSKFKSSQASPLSKHFQSQSDLDDTGDTIDITPKPRVHVPKRSSDLNVISLIDSDQETADADADADDDGHYVYPMKDKGVNYRMWGVENDPNKPSAKGTQNGTAVNQGTGSGLKRKRKMEHSNNAGKSGSSSGSRSGTPRVSAQDKRTKV